MEREKWLEVAPARVALRVALVFLLPSCLWIVFSDRLVAAVFSSPDALSLFQTIKGLLYVGSLSIILYLVVRSLVADFSAKARALLAAQEAAAEAIRLSQMESRALERAKSQFLSGVSHELRTPLNAVIGFSEMLRHPDIARHPEQVRDYAQEIMGAGRALLEMVEAIVACAEAQAGQKLEPELLDLRQEALRAAASARVRAQQRRTGIAVTVPDGLRLWADPQALRQILFALLDNAITHTPPHSKVRLEAVEAADGVVQITIADNGPGLPDAVCRDIGRPFLRDGDPLTARSGGLGLGLYLAALLMHRHGGSIQAENENGARIRLSFPACAAGGPAAID